MVGTRSVDVSIRRKLMSILNNSLEKTLLNDYIMSSENKTGNIWQTILG